MMQRVVQIGWERVQDLGIGGRDDFFSIFD